MSKWDLLNHAIAEGVIKPEELNTSSMASVMENLQKQHSSSYAAERQRRPIEMPVQYQDQLNGTITPLGMLFIRLRKGKMPGYGESWAPSFKTLEIIDARIAGETAYVTLSVKNGKPIIVEDGAELFPSDRLISQLYTLAG